MRLVLRNRTIDLTRRVAVMAIVNRTPDSFYDRGATLDLEVAVEHALAQVAAGADLIDVGGVKAGPGPDVPEAVEHERVVDFVTAFRARSGALLSVDTYCPEVAGAALDAGADLVNDVSGLAHPEIADAVAARPGTGLVVMHAGGAPRTRPFRPTYEPDVTSAVRAELERLATTAQDRGVAHDAIVVDPGHDFGKTTYHSLELTRRLPDLATLGYPVLVALSRKDFLGEVLGPDVPPAERLDASLAAAAVAAARGARILRVHDTAATVRVARTVEAIMGWQRPATAVRGLA